jgi:hypothetical protein
MGEERTVDGQGGVLSIKRASRAKQPCQRVRLMVGDHDRPIVHLQ